MKTTEISKAIGQKWNTLSDQDKQPFINQAQQDKQRHEREMEFFNKNGYFIKADVMKSPSTN